MMQDELQNQPKPQIFVAAYSDAQAMIDLATKPTREHFNFIQAAITSRTGYVARVGKETVGYAVMANTFFGHAFISHLFVHPDHRRKSLASMLIRYLEMNTESEKLFSSTPQSNQPACALFAKLGYQTSGQIENLNPHGHEQIYFKRLK